MSVSETERESIENSILDREFTAKDVQAILRILTGGSEKIGLALLNYYARTDLVPSTGKGKCRGRKKYTYSDLLLLCWLFRMKREGLPVNRFRRGIDYLRKRLPKLHRNPTDMVLLTDGRQLFIKHRIEEKGEIAEVLTGRRAGQYVWMYTIGSLIEELDKIINAHKSEESVAEPQVAAA
jgi:DNA-binding transcriptional MerR regulator